MLWIIEWCTSPYTNTWTAKNGRTYVSPTMITSERGPAQGSTSMSLSMWYVGHINYAKSLAIITMIKSVIIMSLQLCELPYVSYWVSPPPFLWLLPVPFFNPVRIKTLPFVVLFDFMTREIFSSLRVYFRWGCTCKSTFVYIHNTIFMTDWLNV